MKNNIKHDNMLEPICEEDGELEKYYFCCRGCTMKGRERIWHNFVSSIADTTNRQIDNSYLALEEEPSNAYDANAIMVVCHGEFYGTVGYVGKEYTQEIKEILSKCDAYRIDMKDEQEAGEREIMLVMTWRKD